AGGSGRGGRFRGAGGHAVRGGRQPADARRDLELPGGAVRLRRGGVSVLAYRGAGGGGRLCARGSAAPDRGRPRGGGSGRAVRCLGGDVVGFAGVAEGRDLVLARVRVAQGRAAVRRAAGTGGVDRAGRRGRGGDQRGPEGCGEGRHGQGPLPG